MKLAVLVVSLVTALLASACSDQVPSVLAATPIKALGETIPAAAADEVVGGHKFGGNSWLGASRGLLVFPLDVHEGCEILAWGVDLFRQSAPGSEYRMRLASVQKGVQTPIAEVVTHSGEKPGQSLIGSTLATATLVAGDKGYVITASRDDGTPDDLVHDAWISRRCP